MDWLFSLLLLPVQDWRAGIILLIIAIYFYLTWNFNYFSKMGISGPKPYPLLGTSYNMFYGNPRQTQREEMHQYGKVWGNFIGSNPTILVAKESIVREILVKQFANFPNHGRKGDTTNKYMKRLLTTIEDDEWRHVRRLLTPTFTAGKLKRMAPTINTCANNLAERLTQHLKDDPVCEMKTFFRRYTMDVIAGTAFGIDVNSQKDPNNDFVSHGESLLNSVTGFNIALMASLVSPSLVPILEKVGFEVFPAKDVDFFTGVVDQILEMREKEDVEGKDFMGMMVSAHKMKVEDDEVNDISMGYHSKGASANENSKGLDKVDIIAAGFVFFFAGFDTVSQGLTAIIHHLAAHPEWQEKVYNEIEGVLQGASSVTYDHLNEMPYLEMVILESLRLDSPVTVTDRECVKDTTIDGVAFKKGLMVMVAIEAIHHDPDNYPDPEKFDPERFSSEAKAARSPYLYLPFGQGPRDCIGKRLALMEIKIAIIRILCTFRLKLAEGEKSKLQYVDFGQIGSAYVKLEKR